MLVLCFEAAIQAQTAAQPATFKVKYIAGPGEFNSDSVRASVTDDSLVLSGKSGKKKRDYVVSLGSIQTMMHSPVRFNRASQVAGTVPNVGVPRLEGGGGGVGAAANLLVIMAWGAYQVGRTTAIGVAATQHGQTHFVEIAWQKRGVEYELLLEASKDDYAELIRQLEERSGKKFIDMDARWRMVEAELKQQKERAVPANLDRRVKLGELSLAPGDYSLVLLPRQENLGELYLFAGKSFDNSALRGVLVVALEATPDNVITSAATFDYTSELPVQIEAIHMPGEILRAVRAD